MSIVTFTSFGVPRFSSSSASSGSLTLSGVGSTTSSLTTYPKTGSVTTGDYFVATTGSDANPGTEASPFLTIQKGLNTAATGETVLVKAGTYTLSSEITYSGTASINLYNYGSDRPIIDGSSLTSSERLFYITGSNLHVKGFELQDSPLYGVRCEGSSNTFEDLHIHDTYRAAIYFYGSGGSNNIAQDCITWRIGNSATSGTNVADGFVATTGGGSLTSGHKFVRCFAANCPDDGFDLFQGSSCSIIDCVAYKAGLHYSAGSLGGDGNGMKLGGTKSGTTGGGHTVQGSFVTACSVSGINTSSGTPALTMTKNTVASSTRGFLFNGTANHVATDNIALDNSTYNVSITEPLTDTYNTWNSSSDAGGNTDFPIDLAGIDFADVSGSDWSLGASSQGINAASGGGNLGASSVALELAKEWISKDLTLRTPA